ncbi:uncharacterized protein LOC127726357 [Mytilus californianus]|uniref:uncharacterized protein LOC127726357 n=1 Tax=Mytilus californianus TaxID=6549 RepID=UPI0022470CCD|nr:uncharacterized protein LOC127726357 [Mytilus californianus]
MWKRKIFKCKKIRTGNDYALRQTYLQRPPSEQTVKHLTKQRQNSSEKPDVMKIAEDDEITEDPEIDESNKIESIKENHDDLDGKKKIKTKPVACIECVKPIQVFKREEINRGDHIKFHGRIYDHHAIVVDVKHSEEKDHKVVVNLVHASNTASGVVYACIRPCASKAKLLNETKQINLKKIKVMVYKYSDTIKHSLPEEIVNRAVTAKSNPDFHYNLLNNNCEHFTTWCVTGERLSLQVRKIRMVVRLFLKRGFKGIGDEELRNRIECENGMLCKPCFERNRKLLSVANQPIKSKDDVKIGDIIKYKYYRCWHAAVVLEIESHDRSLECKIAHYAFRGLHRHRKIREETLRIPFDGSVKVTDFSKTDYAVYAPDEVVERARSRFGEKRYEFFSNDSSHFARWCKLQLYRYRN